MSVVYYAGLFLCNALGTFALQKYGRELRNRIDIVIYALVTGIISMLFFWVSSGFSIVLNQRTILYALILMILSLVSYFVQLPVYRYMGVAEVGVITVGGTLCLSVVLGALIFAERVSIISVIRISLMLVAVLLIFVQKKKKTKKNEMVDGDSFELIKTVTSIGLLLCLFIIVVSAINTIISKYIAIDENITSSDSLFFFTNALIVIFSLVFLLIENRGSPQKCISAFRSTSVKQYATIVTKTVAGSAASLLSVLILANGDVTLYAPLSNALSLLAAESVAVFTLRERPLVMPMIAAVLAVLLAFFG